MCARCLCYPGNAILKNDYIYGDCTLRNSFGNVTCFLHPGDSVREYIFLKMAIHKSVSLQNKANEKWKYEYKNNT